MSNAAKLDRNTVWPWRMILVLFGLMMSWNLAWLLLCSSWDWVPKQGFNISNAAVVVAFLLLLLAMKVSRNVDRMEDALKTRTNSLIWIMTALLLLFQLTYSYYACFYTGWDSETTLECAELLAARDYAGATEEFGWYYSHCENNLLVTWIFSIMIWAGNLFGISPLYAVIVLQCCISAATALLLFRVSLKMTASYTFSWATWVVYALYIGTSPWVMIPYSDAVGLVLPIWLLYLYVNRTYDKKDLYRWFLMGVLTVVAMNLKALTAIVSIAIWMVVPIELIHSTASAKKHIAKRAVAFLFACVLSATVHGQVIVPSCHISLDEEAAFGWSHYAMMGSHVERNGVYPAEDVSFSASFATRAERKVANLQVIEERLKEMGPVGLLRHLGKKTLSNYGDGTFSWGVEGSFYKEMISDRDAMISPFFKNLFYAGGKNYSFFATWDQLIWCGLLVGSLGILKRLKQRPDLTFMVVVLSIIGITLFELIFEARARYFYTFSPLFILLGLLGWRDLLWFPPAPQALSTEQGNLGMQQ